MQLVVLSYFYFSLTILIFHEEKIVRQSPRREEKLKEALKVYPTKDDLRKALNNYPTKTDLQKALSNYPTKFDMEEMESRTDEKARGYRDEILTRLDGVMGELAQMREDKLFTDHDIANLKKKSDDHEEQIKKLETS